MASAQNPVFSIIMATRNRPSLFDVALASVLEQRLQKYEIIVVNDGSSEDHEFNYRNIVAAAPPTVRMLTLVRTERGHGQSYALNYGASHARGDYLCFLDDDDQWTDPGHLSRAENVISASEEQVPLVLANQSAYRNGVRVPGPIWIEDLETRLGRAADPAGAYTVTPTELLTCAAHCHLNTMVVSRSLFSKVGGLDEALRYECDRDFYLRAIDQAELIKYVPVCVSRHNIPDPAARANMSTTLSEFSKRLCQLQVFDKALLFSVRPELWRYAKRQRAYVLKHIAAEAARTGRLDCAAYYAREALIAAPTVGWLAATVLYVMRSLSPLRIAHRGVRRSFQ